jgi:hypothetical protein
MNGLGSSLGGGGNKLSTGSGGAMSSPDRG